MKILLSIITLLALTSCGPTRVLIKKSTCMDIHKTGLAECEKFER